MHEPTRPAGLRAFLAGAIRSSVAGGIERDSIWSVRRPLINLYLALFAIQSGWLVSKIVRGLLDKHDPSSLDGLESIAFDTLSGIGEPGLGAAIISLIIVEGITTVMVMYNLGMNLLVRPIVRWHESRGEARGEARGQARGQARGEALASRRWEEWNQRRMEAEARGERFDEPPPVFKGNGTE